jgi:hypothetical protein
MPFEYKRVPYAENYNDDPHTIAHTPHVLDCVKAPICAIFKVGDGVRDLATSFEQSPTCQPSQQFVANVCVGARRIEHGAANG